MTDKTSDGEPPTREELARKVKHQQGEISYLRDTVTNLSDRMARVEEGIQGVKETLQESQEQAHADSQAINATLNRIWEALGGKADKGDGNGEVKARVERATGAVRFGRWLLATLIAAGSALAMWWDKVVAIVRAVAKG